MQFLQHSIMKMTPHMLESLSRRERQIMEIIYARGRVNAEEVQNLLPDKPSYSAVRAALSNLTKKQHVKHKREGLRYYFEPTEPANVSRISALKRVIETFFNNSAESALATMLSHREMEIGEEELDRLEKLIQEAKRRRSK
jgi:BlaI family penicillinase repressor